MDTAIVIAIVAAAAAVVGRWTWRTIGQFRKDAKPACSCAANKAGANPAACAGCPAAAPRRGTAHRRPAPRSGGCH
jgi:hypothetical protein